MAQVLRYFHLDPKATTSSSSITTTLNLMNTSISNNTRAIEDKLNAITGKSLSSNDFTDYYKDKLRGIEEGAEVNVLADWDENDSTADSYIKNKPIIDTVVTENSNNLITSGAVYTAIDNLPEPMIFKGSLGTGGTILSLPSASSSNKGYTYKVITDDTYNGLTAKAGDVFISDGTTWVYIPSADEPNGTVTNVAVTVPTGLEVSGSPITTSGTLAITYAIGYAIPTLTDQAAWTAKQDAISDLSTIRSRADEGHTAYGWGNHANAGYLMAISDLATIRSRADEGHAAYGWGDHSLAGYQAAISDLATIRSRSDEGHTAYGWGDHSQAGYVKSSGVTSVSMTVPTGLSISGSPITTTGTLALSLANGYSIPTTAKLSNWDTAYGWGDHSLAGYLTGITSAMVTTALGYTPPTTDTNTTYTIATGDSNGLIKVTPSSGNAYNVSVKGLGSRAYDSTSYLPLSGGTVAGKLVMKQGCIWVQGGSDAGGNSNRLTTTSGMPGDMQYNQGRRGVQIYSNGIAFADPYNGNSNNDSAWIRHLETTANTGLFEIAVGDDASNEEIRFRRYNTSNNIVSDVLVPNTTGTLALTSHTHANYVFTIGGGSYTVYAPSSGSINLNNAYLMLSGGTITGSIITPKNDDMGIIPDTNNYGQIGSSSKYFYRSYISNMYGTVKGSFNGGNVTGNDASFYNYKCRNSTGFLIDSYGTFYFNSDGGSGDFNIYNNKNSSMVRAFYINSNNNATLAGTLTLNSDIRLKRIIEDCNIDVESIANAPLFKFRWKNRDDDNNYIGTSAQYWKELIPELVQESDDESNTLSLQYGTLGVVNSISIAKEVVELKEEIKLLQALIAELKLLLK